MKKIYLLTILLAFVISSCEKELDFKYHDISPILVIEGSLTQKGAEVSLTHTTPMDEPMNREHLTDAEVKIYDNTTEKEFQLTPDSSGVFRSEIKGESGHTYRLTVFRNGESYTSECFMKEGVEIRGLEFSWIKMPYDEVAAFQVTFTDNPLTTDDCYWMRVYRNGKAYKWAVLNDLHSSDGEIDKVMMTSRKNLDEEDESDILEPGDLVSVTIVPMSREMHDYLEALSVGNSNGPRMFQGGFCLGYFLAAPIAEKEITFNP